MLMIALRMIEDIIALTLILVGVIAIFWWGFNIHKAMKDEENNNSI